jgi:hypothetical protein
MLDFSDRRFIDGTGRHKRNSQQQRSPRQQRLSNPVCEVRKQLMEAWVAAARDHADALTNLNFSASLLTMEERREAHEELERRRARVESAVDALEEHRRSHGC